MFEDIVEYGSKTKHEEIEVMEIRNKDNTGGRQNYNIKV